MSDLETRLIEALRGAGERAPHPGDLVAPARARLRRRRRTTAAAVAAVVAVVAIPVGLQLADPGNGDPDVAATPDDWRTESFRDLTLRVPPTWGYGAGTDWCAEDAAAPQVSRPGVPDNARCTPAYGYGVVFREESLDIFTDETFPEEAYYDTVGTDEARAWIAAESQEQLDRIVESVEVVGDADPNGCTAQRQAGSAPTEPRATVCRYSADDWLEQSARLSLEATDALRRSLLRAPEFTEPLKCAPRLPAQPYAEVLLDGGRILVPYAERCVGATYVAFNGHRVELTDEIRQWVRIDQPDGRRIGLEGD